MICVTVVQGYKAEPTERGSGNAMLASGQRPECSNRRAPFGLIVRRHESNPRFLYDGKVISRGMISPSDHLDLLQNQPNFLRTNGTCDAFQRRQLPVYCVAAGAKWKSREDSAIHGTGSPKEGTA